MRQVSERLQNDPMWAPNDWAFQRREDLPIQEAGSNDCGVFTIMWAVMVGAEMDVLRLPAEDCSIELRHKIAYSLLKTPVQEQEKVYNVGAFFIEFPPKEIRK